MEFLHKEKQKATRLLAKQPLIIKGSEGLVVTFADCCRPIPGNVIVGILSAGHGMVIHREQCKEIEHLHGTPTCIYLSWQDETPGEFYTEIVADVYNKRGVLAELFGLSSDWDRWKSGRTKPGHDEESRTGGDPDERAGPEPRS